VHTCTGSAAALAAAESAWQPGAPGCDTKTASKPAGHVHDVQRVGLRAVKARRRRADAPTSAVLVSIAALCQAFRDAGRPIVHVVRLYAADGSNPELARKDLVSGPTPVLRPGFPGRLLAPGLAPEGASNSMTSYFCRASSKNLVRTKSPCTNCAGERSTKRASTIIFWRPERTPLSLLGATSQLPPHFELRG